MQNLLENRDSILNLSEDHIFRKLFESSVEGMIILDKQGIIITANPSCLKMFGYEKEELTNKPIEKLFLTGYQVFYRTDENSNIKPILDGLHKKKEIFPVSVSISQAMMETEHFVIGFLVDVTERIMAEQERTQFSRIFDESLNEIYILDTDSWKFLSVNKGALHHLGYTLDEMKKMTILDINPVLSEKEIKELIYPLETGMKNKVQFESVRIRKNGSTYPVEASIQFTNFFSKKAFLIIAMDTTDRKSVQQKLMSAIVSGQEKERKRIAKELHDGLGQYLSAANYNIDTLGFQMKGDTKKEKTVLIIRRIIENSIEELRSISRNLHPRVLENQGLPKAIEGLCESIGSSKELKIQTHIDDLDTRLTDSLEIGLFRIAQELLNNMLKHSKAKNVNLQLVRHSDSLLLLVEDDGIGFESSELVKPGFEGSGIRNITTQSKALNGTCHFDSSPGNGTSVTIEIPL